MKYVDEYRDGDKARDIAAAIAAEVRPDRSYALMEFCGGHTHAISRYGIEDLLPSNVRMIHGPGCPVCVLPIGRIDDAIRLARLAHHIADIDLHGPAFPQSLGHTVYQQIRHDTGIKTDIETNGTE